MQEIPGHSHEPLAFPIDPAPPCPALWFPPPLSKRLIAFLVDTIPRYHIPTSPVSRFNALFRRMGCSPHPSGPPGKVAHAHRLQRLRELSAPFGQIGGEQSSSRSTPGSQLPGLRVIGAPGSDA
jgi:hypothetical protein